jgi:hypothetical protein
MHMSIYDFKRDVPSMYLFTKERYRVNSPDKEEVDDYL